MACTPRLTSPGLVRLLRNLRLRMAAGTDIPIRAPLFLTPLLAAGGAFLLSADSTFHLNYGDCLELIGAVVFVQIRPAATLAPSPAGHVISDIYHPKRRTIRVSSPLFKFVNSIGPNAAQAY